MPHSHLVVQHLMKQLEIRAAQPQRADRRPEWLSQLIVRWSAAFEPNAGVGRIGFVAEPEDGGWSVRLYLGTTEIVGGKDDGEWRQPGFEMNVSQITEAFTRIDEFRWNVAALGPEGTHSFVTIRGLIGEYAVQVKVYSRPPRDAGPAFRRHLDGTVEEVESR